MILIFYFLKIRTGFVQLQFDFSQMLHRTVTSSTTTATVIVTAHKSNSSIAITAATKTTSYVVPIAICAVTSIISAQSFSVGRNLTRSLASSISPKSWSNNESFDQRLVSTIDLDGLASIRLSHNNRQQRRRLLHCR